MHPIVPVLQLLKELLRIDGRKKLQKTVHILKELGAPFQERFEYSYYGMYSSQLKGELDTLEREGLVKENSVLVGTNTTYVLESTPELGKLLKELDLEAKPAWVEIAKELNKLSPQVLEGVSTILFLRKTESEEKVIRQRLPQLKPRLVGKVDECFEEANRISKIRFAKN